MTDNPHHNHPSSPLSTSPTRLRTVSNANITSGTTGIPLNITDNSVIIPPTMDVIELKLNRRVELPKEAKFQWKNRNLPLIKDMEVKIVAWQEMDMLNLQVTLSIPQPPLGSLNLPNDKIIDFKEFNEEAWREEEDKRRALLSSHKTNAAIVLPPIEITMNFKLTDAELSIFGAVDKVDNKAIKLGRDTTLEHPATFVWNIMSRLHVHFKVRCSYSNSLIFMNVYTAYNSLLGR